ncbi:Prophage tail fibre N-terminal [Yersinia similis]|nr:Prophage tail fibre N-terminal [Yersinia similis]
MSGCQIILKAGVNTAEVVMRTIATITTDGNGKYSFEAQVGKYHVYLRQYFRTEYCVGEITVYDDSKPGTLNDFLTALDEGDLKPDVIKRFEEMVAQAQQSAEAAARSAQEAKLNAKQTAQDVLSTTQSRNDTERFANKAKESATAAAGSQADAAESAKQSSASAEASANSAKDAATHAESAKQSKEDAVGALASALKIDNNLSEIADAGVDARQQAQAHLGLGTAATRGMQSDIYDRTEGRLAIPGAFGYGAYFRHSKQFSGNNGPAELLTWVKETPPGRYYVSQYGGSQPIIPGVVFSGVIEIEIPNIIYSSANQRQQGKLIKFYGVNGDLYFNRLNINSISGDYFIGWENLKLKISDFTGALRSTTGNAWGSPDVGGLIFATYHGDSDDDNNRKLFRGKGVPGSRLGMVSMKASCSTSGTYVSTPQFAVASPNSYPQPGTFIALSGSTLTTIGKTEAFIGLFIRIA